MLEEYEAQNVKDGQSPCAEQPGDYCLILIY